MKLLTEEFKGLPQDFLQPKTTENSAYTGQQAKNSHRQDTNVQHSCRGVYNLQDRSGKKKQCH